MIENDAAGKAIGYEAGRRIHLVRNPNWDESLDNRPAYVDEIEIQQGNDDATVMSRKILEGESMINGDSAAPAGRSCARPSRRRRTSSCSQPAAAAAGSRSTRRSQPFDDINVRKAVSAGMDRDALRLTRGGEVIGDIATHYLPPGMSGFEEAGGMEGFGVDFMANPEGDEALMAEYFKKAGFASGKYEGTEEVLMVGDNEGVGAKTAEVAASSSARMGFNVELRQVTRRRDVQQVLQRAEGQGRDLPERRLGEGLRATRRRILEPTFNGNNIIPTNNVNWPQLDVPEINQAMAEASLLIDPAERAKAWAEIDRDDHRAGRRP